MNTVIGIIFLAALAVIGTVQWLRALVEALERKDAKAALWPAVTGVFALFLGAMLAWAFPELFDGLGAGAAYGCARAILSSPKSTPTSTPRPLPVTASETSPLV